MKTRTALCLFTLLPLLAAAVPAWADYDNGPINGNIDAWTINFGYIVRDTFVPDAPLVTGFMFGVREFPGDRMLTVDWSITSEENGGQVLGSGKANVTDQYLSTNQFGYQVDLITVTGLNVGVTSGDTYWLNLQNASIANGDPVYWDENSGIGCKSKGCPSSASESAVGTIPSEAFTINTSGGTVPEPSSFILFGSGICGLAGLLRRGL